MHAEWLRMKNAQPGVDRQFQESQSTENRHLVFAANGGMVWIACGAGASAHRYHKRSFQGLAMQLTQG